MKQLRQVEDIMSSATALLPQHVPWGEVLAHAAAFDSLAAISEAQSPIAPRCYPRRQASCYQMSLRLPEGCRGFISDIAYMHELSKFERMVLLVCTLTAIDQRVTCALECLDGVSWTTTPDVMFLIAKKGFADRLKFRESYGPDSALMRNGLIRWEQTTPEATSMTTSNFHITPWAFDLLIGRC
jgi:hypothetical protein